MARRVCSSSVCCPIIICKKRGGTNFRRIKPLYYGKESPAPCLFVFKTGCRSLRGLTIMKKSNSTLHPEPGRVTSCAGAVLWNGTYFDWLVGRGKGPKNGTAAIPCHPSYLSGLLRLFRRQSDYSLLQSCAYDALTDGLTFPGHRTGNIGI